MSPRFRLATWPKGDYNIFILKQKRVNKMYIADLHIHSRFSRATSRDLTPEQLDYWAGRKGIQILGTGDFTHPAWREELQEKLVPAEDGLYALRDELRLTDRTFAPGGKARFVISGEISSIYKKNGKVRKVHSVILLPSLEAAQLLSKKMRNNWKYPFGRPADSGPGLPGPVGDHPGNLPGRHLHSGAYLDAAFFAVRSVFRV